MNREVVIYMPRSQTVEVKEPVRYSMVEEVVLNKYIRWAMNKAFSFMIKKGYLCERKSYTREVLMETVTVDLDRLDEEIMRNMDALHAVYNRKISTIICGHDIISKIVNRNNNLNSMGLQTVQLNGPSRYGRVTNTLGNGFQSESVTYMGLDIILVPWFEGFLLIPNK